MSWQNKINMRKNISLAKKKKMMSWIKALEQFSVCRVLEDIHSRYNNILTNNRILEFRILELIVFQSFCLQPSSMIYICMCTYAYMCICVLYIYIYIYIYKIYWIQSYFLWVHSVYSLMHSIFPIWWAFRLFPIVFVLFMPL